MARSTGLGAAQLLGCSLMLGAALAAQDKEKAKALPHKEFATHASPVISAVVGASGKTVYVATTTTGAKARVFAWDLTKTKKKWEAEFERHEGASPKVEPKAKDTPPPLFPMDRGKRILVISDGKMSFSYFDLSTGKKLGQSLPSKENCGAIVCDPRDRWTWLGSENDALTRLVPRSPNALLSTEIENGGVRALALDKTGAHAAVGGKNGSIQFMKTANAKIDEKKIFKHHEAPVTALAWAPRNKSLISADAKGRVVVVSVSKGKILHELKGHNAEVCLVAFHPKGHFAATGDTKGVMVIWDLAKGTLLHRVDLPDAAKSGVRGLAFVERGKRLLSAGGRKVLLWDVAELGK